MATFCLSLPSFISSSSVSSSLGSSISESCCCSSLSQNSRGCAVSGRRRRNSELHVLTPWQIRTTATAIRAEARASSHFTAESQSNEGSNSSRPSTLALKVETGRCNGVLSLRIASLATAGALFANVVCGNSLAAGGASTGGSDENSNFMFVVICIGEAIALTGAAVGGVLARQRKVELEKLNAQLRQINVNLRRQSRVETYAPNLTYAPVGSGRMVDLQVRGDPVRDELMHALRTGKRWLREQSPAQAYEEFQKALALAQKLKDTVEQKKATRGLGASCQRQGKYKEAIGHHSLVLDISRVTGESSGDTEAYGAMADCYTELGDLETAGKYYDRYIERLESDDTL